MQSHWLNKQNNNKLIIFFTGWSFDYKPFEFLNCEDFDVLIIYDYNDLELPQIPEYKEYFLISWSMGVYTSYLLKDKLPKFTKKIAINGTPFPVNDEYGIPLKPFILTLRLNTLYSKIKSTEISYQNYFDTAIISNNDKIIPTKNQINFWEGKAEIKTVESGHFLYYNFTSWNEILCK